MSPDPDSIDEALGAHHAELGGLLADFTRALGGETAAAAALLDRFSRGLAAHMEWEERILFPGVRAHATAAQTRSIESLEIDHERLRDTLAGLQAAVAANDVASARPKLDWLETLLKGHNYDEEHGVYVEADRFLSVEERRRIIGEFLRGRPS